ncbi:hypothetical protein EVAR_5352_1 [Eumeta japonica]|uniref:Uncharacterized protein n=1 Tax=Eumeta variegata TaxID=151549 RepID=A0A4C1TNY4_EUMVA|nr:hypothetical protein EVAR_5352_1 [Eumeta japonica]
MSLFVKGRQRTSDSRRAADVRGRQRSSTVKRSARPFVLKNPIKKLALGSDPVNSGVKEERVRGALILRIASFAGNSERESFVGCTTTAAEDSNPTLPLPDGRIGPGFDSRDKMATNFNLGGVGSHVVYRKLESSDLRRDVSSLHMLCRIYYDECYELFYLVLAAEFRYHSPRREPHGTNSMVGVLPPYVLCAIF